METNLVNQSIKLSKAGSIVASSSITKGLKDANTSFKSLSFCLKVIYSLWDKGWKDAFAFTGIDDVETFKKELNVSTIAKYCGKEFINENGLVSIIAKVSKKDNVGNIVKDKAGKPIKEYGYKPVTAFSPSFIHKAMFAGFLEKEEEAVVNAKSKMIEERAALAAKKEAAAAAKESEKLERAAAKAALLKHKSDVAAAKAKEAAEVEAALQAAKKENETKAASKKAKAA